MKNTTDGNQPSWWLVPTSGEPTSDVLLPQPFFNRYNHPERYDPGASLLAAVNVALLLGQPLLLTGEPGSGKTSLAYWLARELGLEKPLVHVVKSSTTGKDLLYSFDELGRFRDAQRPQGLTFPQQKYVELNALGLGILFSADRDVPLPRMMGHTAEFEHDELLRRDLYRSAFPTARRQVVLIDELDKAPTDTPNDLLSEVERMEFEIPEIGVVVPGDPSFRPIVVITSNSDKSLPDAFLRRCVYHHISAPSAERRREIIAKQRPALLERGELYRDAMAIYDRIQVGLGRNRRQPGTAELLAWLDIIDAIYPQDVEYLAENMRLFSITLKALVKTDDDLRSVCTILDFDLEKYA